ncbi:hypothetical protein FRUB_08834 [Fimbriiglobus ruber]|uniref:Uncharacterized protein n=1 Tax=Fimbriiglobus ruber TaxID=1908690 RepID=A0A225D3U8_9BACT|nr:hypothetical protein FRUB_08834 [Fimbriiglobus ruber]
MHDNWGRGLRGILFNVLEEHLVRPGDRRSRSLSESGNRQGKNDQNAQHGCEIPAHPTRLLPLGRGAAVCRPDVRGTIVIGTGDHCGPSPGENGSGNGTHLTPTPGTSQLSYPFSAHRRSEVPIIHQSPLGDTSQMSIAHVARVNDSCHPETIWLSAPGVNRRRR